MEAETTYQY